MRSGCPKRCSGFTIVEVLVAMTVTAVGLLGVFGALVTAANAADRVRDEEAAQLLAERRMTGLLAGPLTHMGVKHGQEGRFGWEEQLRLSRQPGVAEVEIRVRWHHRGRPMMFELISLGQTE